MDIVIKKITKNYLAANINDFINILKDEKYEYWQVEHFLLEFPMKFEISLMALENNRLIGYIIASKKENGAYIHKFMIEKKHRGIEVGSLLQREFEKIVYKKNIKDIYLSVYQCNEKGIMFYKKNKYFKFKERNDDFDNNIVVMKKNISL